MNLSAILEEPERLQDGSGTDATTCAHRPHGREAVTGTQQTRADLARKFLGQLLVALHA
jgi:hypothetical protein